MLVRCTNTEVAGIADEHLREHISRHVHLEDIGLERGNEYPVIGVHFREGRVWYFLCDDEDAEYPRPYHAAFFEKIDDYLPNDWVLLDDYPSSVVPREWAETPNFLERLVEGDPIVEAHFESIKTRIFGQCKR